MKVFHTDQISPSSVRGAEKDWIYNGLDCCITAEVLEVLKPQLDNLTASTYAFSRSLQGPVLEMRLRGIRVDQAKKAEVIQTYRERLNTLEHSLNEIVGEGCGFWEFNWQSPKQVQELLYDYLGIPPVVKQGRATVNRDALERLDGYIIARPIINHITAMRELQKKISVLKTDIDPDGRIRTSYNIAGTETGRFSSSLSEFGTGGNLQNIEELLRSIFIADPGMKMAYFDAEQGESRVVGAIEWNLFGEKGGAYLDACEGGDLHTTVAKLVWTDLPWTGNLKLDKALAEEPYYRHYSRRFMCKKIGHGTNYDGRPRTLAQQSKVDISLVEEFQPLYFEAFPAHKWWHQHVDNELRSTGELVSLTGRKRQFWGRRDSGDTLREAIAYDPQGSLADIVNAGMLSVWRARSCELLMQNHDAIVVQYPEEKEDEIVPKIIEQLRYPLELREGREFVIPYGAKTGWNFGLYCCGDKTKCKGCPAGGAKNVDGLKEYQAGKDKRTRSPALRILDRQVR
jgi:DNA polymerase-1